MEKLTSKTVFVLLLAVILCFACRSKKADPGPNDTNTVPDDTTEIVDSVDIIPSSMNIQFLLNPGAENERFKFILADSLTIFFFKKTEDIIGVNTEEWACDPIHVPMIFTDTAYRIDKTYHLKMFVNGDSINQAGHLVKFGHQSHDFTFKVDTSGEITNLQTQNLTSCVNQFYQPVDDVTLKCNKLILNYRIWSNQDQVVQSE